MKKRHNSVKYLVLLLICSAALTCCTHVTNEQSDEKKVNVVATVFPQFDFARAVGAERVNVKMLMSPGADSHEYSGDNPSDILTISQCDLFIAVGGETDSEWVKAALSRIEKSTGKTPRVIFLTDVCDTVLESDSGMIEAEDAEEGEEYDEHVWTSLKNCEKAVDAVKTALCELDPEGKEEYEKNAEKYSEKLRELDLKFTELFDGESQKILVFADRFPFRYFALEHGLTCYAAFGGCASQSEPSPTTIVKLCDIVKENGLDCIFYMETSQSSVPDVISKATDAQTYMLHSCHTVSEKQLKDGITFTDLWEENYQTLEKALKNGK